MGVANLLESNGLQVVLYSLVAVTALVAFLRERRRLDASRVDLWPPFWLLTAAVLVLMAVALAGDIGDLLADIGRREARESGWYADRRSFQTVAVVSICSVWAMSTVVAVWRFPERRRRYLPITLAMVSLICYAGIRILSLHQIDALLYRTEVAGVRLATVAELLLLAATAATTLWDPAPRVSVDSTRPSHPSAAAPGAR